MFPGRAKWAPQGRRRRKYVGRGRPDLFPISLSVMAICSLRWILPTHSRSSLNMQGFEPSSDLDFENGFSEKCCQLRIYFFETVLLSSMRPRGNVNIKGFELAAILVAPSDFESFFLRPLRAPEDGPGGGKSSVFVFSIPRSSSKQKHCIFIMDYVAPCPPTL